MREILVALCFVFGSAAALRSTLFAACFFMWNDIFRPLAWARYAGFLKTFPSHHILTALLAFGFIFRPPDLRWNRGSTLILVFNAWIWFCYMFAQYPGVAFEECFDATSYLLPMAFISALIRDRRSQKIYLYTLALCVGIHMAWSGLHAAMSGRPQVHMSIRGGQMSDRNDFLVGGTAALPLIGFMAWHYVGKWQRHVRLGVKAVFGLSIMAFVFSLSRGAIIGLTMLGFWYSVATGRVWKRMGIMLVVVALGLPFVPDFVWERMSTLERPIDEMDGSAVNRFEAAMFGVNMTLEHPLVGVGPDCFVHVAMDTGQKAIEPHVIWLKCSAEYGIPMLLFFLYVLASTVWRLRRVMHDARAAGDRETEAMATMLSCSIVGFAATGTFTSQFISQYLWGILGLANVFVATPWRTESDDLDAGEYGDVEPLRVVDAPEGAR